MKMSTGSRWFFGILIGVFLVPIVVVVGGVGSFAALIYFNDRPFDIVLALVPSPTRAHDVEVVRQDNGAGFGLGEQRGILRLRGVAKHRPGPWQDVLIFDERDLDRMNLPPVWTDANHLVVTFAATAWTPSERKTVMGVEVDIRRSDEGKATPLPQR